MRLIERPPGWFRLLFPGAVFRMPPEKDNRPAVYLTFDDGPIPEVTPWVLDCLDHCGVKATFFMVGQNVERNPQLLQEVKERGHQVGNHTLHHIRGLGIPASDYMADAKAGEKLTGSRLFRPPHGWLSGGQLKIVRKDYKVIMYDLVTRDYSRRVSAEGVFDNVKKYARPGSIIVFHDSLKSYAKLKEALPRCIEWLKKEGYTFRVLQ